MGEWHHPAHYTETAKAFAIETRRIEIKHTLDHTLVAIREAARALGYAVAVHGSLARDLDLIAIPWTDEAADADTVVIAIAAAVKQCTGWGMLDKRERWSAKPHGRVATTIIATAEVHIDLSIMPRASAAASEVP
jgi:hypothetical protein